MPAQPTVGADQRSAFPQYPGVPWWAAVVIAVGMTLAGLGIEAVSGHQELGSAFAIGYSLGCVIAVLAVRRSGVFTAVIQPPLLLFVAVPLASYMFHRAAFNGLKEVLITCGYPLIERFPLMLFTSSTVLLIGLVRWYLGSPHAATRSGLVGRLSAAVSSPLSGPAREQQSRQPRSRVERSPAGARNRESARDRGAQRPRRPRPADEPAPQRPRRDGTRRPERSAGHAPDRPSAGHAPDRRSAGHAPDRRNAGQTPDRRSSLPPRQRRDPRDPYPPRPSRSSRDQPYDVDRRYPPEPPYPPYPSPQADPRRRPAPGSAPADRHPISRVRYRDSDPSDPDHRYR